MQLLGLIKRESFGWEYHLHGKRVHGRYSERNRLDGHFFSYDRRGAFSLNVKHCRKIHIVNRIWVAMVVTLVASLDLHGESIRVFKGIHTSRTYCLPVVVPIVVVLLRERG